MAQEDSHESVDDSLPAEEWSDFRDELRKTQRGVRIMWFLNFLFVSLIFNAGLIIVFLEATATNQQIIQTLLLTTPVSLVISAVVMIIVTANSRQFIAKGIGAQATEVESGVLYDAVEEMVIASGSGRMPRVYIDESNVLNAYALGDSQGNSHIAFTRPMLDTLTRDELTAVAGHEMSHITQGDSVDMQKLVALSSMTTLISSVGLRMMLFGGGGNNQGGNKANPIAIALIIISLLFLIFAPILSKLGNSFMSRKRETRADNLAVKYTRDPSALASALSKINGMTYSAVSNSKSTKKDAERFDHAAGALAFYKPGFLGKAFSTHPPFEERIENLRRMGAVFPEEE